MQYPHWLMVAGTLLVVIGFVGFALQKTTLSRLKMFRSKKLRLKTA